MINLDHWCMCYGPVRYMHDHRLLSVKCPQNATPHIRTWRKGEPEPWRSPGSLLLTSGTKQRTWDILATCPRGMPFGHWLNVHAETDVFPVEQRLNIGSACPHLFMQHVAARTYKETERPQNNRAIVTRYEESTTFLPTLRDFSGG